MNMRESFEYFYALNWDDCDVFMHKQWEAAWNASRAALVVELPEEYPATRAEMYVHNARYNDAIEECRQAIHATGVSTK